MKKSLVMLALFAISSLAVAAQQSNPVTTQQPAQSSAASSSQAASDYQKGMQYQTGSGVRHAYQTASDWTVKTVKTVPQESRSAWNTVSTSVRKGYNAATEKVQGWYREGKGVPRNDQQAEVWLLKSAKQGYAPAQLALAKLYFNGNSASKINLVQAYAWSTAARSHKKGLSLAQYISAQSIQNQSKLALSPKRREAAESLASQYLTMH